MIPEHNGHGTAGGAAHPFARSASLIPNEPAAAWVEERTRVAVGRNVNVSGRLVFHEPVRIEGRFRGEVSSAELVVISEGATIEGKVRAPRLLIMGELRGDIAGSKRVVLGPHSRVDGNIETESLTICEGAHFDGHVRMTFAGRGN
ncbi:MAG: bactofilin family protein [Candidatus Binataceae bacterium]